jgi:hypothetical protein
MLRRLFAVGFAVFVTMYIIIGVWQRDVRRGVSLGVDALCDCVGAVQGPPRCAQQHGQVCGCIACYSHIACAHRDVGVVRDGA